MGRIQTLVQDVSIGPVLAAIEAEVAETVELAVTIQQIPAPTFAEVERARFVRDRFAALGLVDIFQDSLHTVYGRYPSTNPAAHPPVIVSAHLDTVFAAEVDLKVRRHGRYVHGPGIGDNSVGVAGILAVAELLGRFRLQMTADVWFVANVCEEGLGDLRGMRAVVEHFGDEGHYIVVEGGLFGQLSHQGIGVRRFRIATEATGGHSWGSFGATSAIHVLGHLIAAIDQLQPPTKPKTTYNVGVIEGGTTINTIAQSASLLLDLRSEEVEALATLEEAVEGIVVEAQRRYDVKIAMELIGDRPVGYISRQSDIVVWAQAALAAVGHPKVAFIAGSTDANIPLSRGVSAVCIGLTKSMNAHRLDEYIDTTFLPKGLTQLLLLILATGGYS